jgi:hypothetical protein
LVGVVVDVLLEGIIFNQEVPTYVTEQLIPALRETTSPQPLIAAQTGQAIRVAGPHGSAVRTLTQLPQQAAGDKRWWAAWGSNPEPTD